MIPRHIHYVWMGGKPKPFYLRRCIKTFHQKGFTVTEWNESNFDVNSHPFLRDAYSKKQWAFVSDFVRMSVIYKYGGIYMDTDVVVVSDLTPLLQHDCFVGFENEHSPFTATFGAVAGHPLIKNVLSYYDTCKLTYCFEDNNTNSVSRLLMEKYGCKADNSEQDLPTGIHVYPYTRLCMPGPNSITLHLFLGSWVRTTTWKKKLSIYAKCYLNQKLLMKAYLWYLKRFRGHAPKG